MRAIRGLICVAIALTIYSSRASADELTSLQRTLGKEPKYQSDSPRYALLVFGKKMTKRVWLVIDGDFLHADLNGNGDLTEEGEKIAKVDLTNRIAPDGMVQFEISEIHDGSLVHRSFCLTSQLARKIAAPTADFRELVAKDANALAYQISGQLQVLGASGTGIEGRKKVQAWVDADGPLQFAEKAEDAPVIHFGGKPKLGLVGIHELIIGRSSDLSLGIGAKGLGKGTMAWIELNEIPKNVDLLARVSFPKSSTEATVPPEAEYPMTDRYSTFHFLGELGTPTNIGPGIAEVQCQLRGLLDSQIPSEAFSIEVVKPKTDLTLAPVTKRLKEQFIFAHRDGIVGQIKFSPDGSRLFGADYPGGLVTVWDVRTSEPLVEIETGAGTRGTAEFAHVTPNWKHFYVWFDPSRKIEQIEINGNPGIRASYSGALRGWSLDNGEEIAFMQHDPPHGSAHAVASPDGSWIATLETVPGDFGQAEWGQTGYSTSIWDLESKSNRLIGTSHEFPIFASEDSRFLAMWNNDRRSFQWYDILTAEPVWKYDPGEGFQATPTCSTSDGMGLIVSVAKRDPKTFSYLGSWLKIIDLATGVEKSSYEVDAKLGSGARPIKNDLGRSLFELVTYEFANSTLRRVDSRLMEEKEGAFHELVRVNFPSGNPQMAPNTSRMALSPQGELAALLVSEYPTAGEVNPMIVTPLDYPQPQLWFLDMASGKMIEKCNLPQAFPNSLAFSPDGKTIAVTGNGRVHLLDVSDLVKTKD